MRWSSGWCCDFEKIRNGSSIALTYTCKFYLRKTNYWRASMMCIGLPLKGRTSTVNKQLSSCWFFLHTNYACADNKTGADPERCKYYKWQKKDNFKLSNEKLVNLHVKFNKNINIADLIMFMFCLECFVSYFFGCIFFIRTFFN